MPGTQGPNLGLYWGYGHHEDGWGDESYNPAMAMLDAITFLSVISAAIATPPGSPAAGDRYIVAASPTGAWSGHAKDLAIYRASAWSFYTPKAGWRAFNQATSTYFRYNGTAWVEESAGVAALDDLSDVVITTPTTGQVLKYNGTNFVNDTVSGGGGGSGLFAPSIAVPTQSGTGLTTWTNQGGATAADTAAGIAIKCTFSFASHLRFLRKAVPATPYRVRALIALNSQSPSQYQAVAFGWYDGTNKLQTWKMQFQNTMPSPSLVVVRQSDPDTYVSSDFTGTWVPSNPVWVELRDDGTTVYFNWSADGVNWDNISYSIAKASGYLGSSGYAHILFGLDPNNQNSTATLMSYQETT